MFFSRWKYLFRVHFVSPCTSIISTFAYKWPPDLPSVLSNGKPFMGVLSYYFQVNII